MGKKASKKASAEATIKTIRCKTRRKYSAAEKIRTVLEGLRGEGTVAELCRLTFHQIFCNRTLVSYGFVDE